jgi:hypothetical protein
MAGLDPATHHQMNHSRADARVMGGWLKASHDRQVQAQLFAAI